MHVLGINHFSFTASFSEEIQAFFGALQYREAFYGTFPTPQEKLRVLRDPVSEEFRMALYQNDAEVLFPPRVLRSLRHLRGPAWQQLVEYVMQQPESAAELLAFSLLMIRLDGCLTCQADSYRAMRGCTACAQQAISRFKGSDEDLVLLWEMAFSDITYWLETGRPR